MVTVLSGRIGKLSFPNIRSPLAIVGCFASGNIFSATSSFNQLPSNGSVLLDRHSSFMRRPAARFNASPGNPGSSPNVNLVGGPGGNDNIMKDIEIKRLDGVDIAVIHKCWHEAFSDYQLPFQLPLERLRVRLSQVNYNPTLSYGAFSGDKLVGFWLSGYREINGKKHGYDAGTAIIPEWRGEGLSGKLFSVVEDTLRKTNVSQYLLEVFCDNHSAINLYKKNSFLESRILHCYRVEMFNVDSVADERAFSVRKTSLSDLEGIYSDFLDYVPSWQNTWLAMRSAEESTMPMVVEDDSGVVGYGIFQPISRRISQMGFRKNVDQDAVARVLVKKFYEKVGNTGELEVVNVPDGDSVIHDLLPRIGFSHLASLYEMKKQL